MSDEIIKVLDYLGKKFGIAIDWSNENLIPYIYDLMDRVIRYEICSSVIYIIISVLICIGCVITIRKVHKHASIKLEKDPECGWELCEYLLIGLLMVVFVISALSCINSITHIIQCIFIPEKIFIQYIQSIEN